MPDPLVPPIAQQGQPAAAALPDIKPQREPNVKDKTLEDQMDDRMKKHIQELRTSIKKFDIDGTSIYRMKMMTARNQRHGIKQISNIPYPGAPDIPLPEADKIIRKQKPNFVLAAISGKNIMEVTAAEGVQNVDDILKQKSRKANLLMNDLFRNKIPWARRLTLAADRSLEKGSAIFKIIERFKSRMVAHVISLDDYSAQQIEALRALPKEGKTQFLVDRYGFDTDNDFDKKEINNIIKQFEAGKKVIEFNTEEVSSLPDVIVPLNEKVYVPQGTGSDISLSYRVTHEYFISRQALVDGMLKDIYIKENVDKILTKKFSADASETDINEQTKAVAEGVESSRIEGENYRVQEVLSWYQPEEGKPFERWCWLFLADISAPQESIIKYSPYQFEEDEWPYVKHDNEITDDRYYASRGVPEQIRAIQEMEERAINNLLIRDEINNAPMFTVLKNSAVMAHQIRFIPGQKIPVASHEEIRPLIEGRQIDVSSVQISQILKAYAEEYVGSTDQLFRNATNAGGGKTLGEIQQGTAKSQYIQSLDILNWLDTLRKVYTKVFYVLRERLTTPMTINGEVITREDFNFIPDIRPSGSLEEADRDLQLQKSVVRLNIIRQAKADGCATAENIFNAYSDYVERDGQNDPSRLLTDPAIILQQQITQLEQKAQQMNQLIAQQNQVLAQGEQSLNKIHTTVAQAAQKEGIQNAGQDAGAAGAGQEPNPSS